MVKQVRQVSTDKLGWVTYQNLNPMAGIPGYYVELEDGSRDFWTLGECEVVGNDYTTDRSEG